MDRSFDYLKKLNIKNQNVILGCSGGPDSMCLLNILEDLGINVICVHINHNIRKESSYEYIEVRNYCNKKSIIFEGFEFSKKVMSEAYYRKERYKIYKNVAKKYQTNIIMTAHHADDLIETILMRIARGSKLKGYAGFSEDYEEDSFRFIKPLIFHTKDEIIKYNKFNGIPYFTDSTNNTDNYTRNRYRHHILPFLKKENSSIHKKYYKFSKELRLASEFIERTVSAIYSEVYKNNSLILEKYMGLDVFIKKNVLQKIFTSLYKDDIDRICGRHVEDILNLLSNNKNFVYKLPNGWVAKREYSILRFENEEESTKLQLGYDIGSELPNGYVINYAEDDNDNSNFVIRLNSKDINLPLKIRFRKDGDRIHVKNLNGTKKIKSIFIDNKIAPSKRDIWPILCDSNDEILWLPGLKKSKFDIQHNKKYDIMLKYIRKEEINEKK